MFGFPLIMAFGFLFPLTACAAVLRYRFWEVGLVSRRIILYTLLAGALVSGYWVIAYAVSEAAAWLFGPGVVTRSTVVAIAALLVGVLANPLRLFLRLLLNRTLYRYYINRDRYRNEAAALLSSNQPPEAVTELLTENATQRLGLVGAWIALPEELALPFTHTLGGARFGHL